MRRQRLLLWLAAALLATAPGRAEIPLGGRLTLDDGAPLAGAAVELLPLPTAFERGRDELAGRLEPAAVAATASDEAGRFELVAPEPGFWAVRVAADGLVPAVAWLTPLVEQAALPALTLRASRPLTVVVRGPDGGPVAGAVVTATGNSPSLWRGTGPRRTVWWPATRQALTDEGGVARLDRAAGEALTVRAFARGLSPPEPAESSDGRLELRLGAARPVTVEATDPRGAPVAGALILAGDEQRAAGLTGEDGRLATALAGDAQLLALAADGGHAAARVPGAGGTVVLRLAPAETVSGRVIDAATREPLAGALVWADGWDQEVARSDAGGHFRLAVADRRGTRAVQAAARGYLPERAAVSAAVGETVLALHPAAAALGRVVDADGAPVAGVELTAEVEGRARGALRRAFRGQPARALSGEDGGFRLAGLPPEVALRLVGRKPGWADAGLELPPLAAGEARAGLRLTIGRGAGLTGRVTGTGEPLAGAEITLVREPRGPSPFGFVTSRRTDGGRSAASDAEGRFQIAHLAPGRYRLTVRAAGFAALAAPGIEVGAAAGEVDLGTLELEPGVEIAGTVVDTAGLPVAGAEVLAISAAPGAGRWGGRGEPLVSTGEDGRFVLSDRRAGELVDLQVTRAGHVDATVRAVEAPPDEPLTIVLESAATIAGRVVDPRGEPVALAMVTAVPDGGGGPAGRASTHGAATDETGIFELDGLAPGPLRITAQGHGWLASEPLRLELPPGGRRDGLRLELRHGATIGGRVLTADGEPATAVTVSVQPTLDARLTSRPPFAATDGDGRYLIEGVEPGVRTVIAHGDELGRTAREIEVAPGANRLDLRFAGGVEVSGRVVDAAGAPVGGATVALLTGGGDWRGAETRSAADGGFVIAGVRDGLHLVRAAKSGYAGRTLEPPLNVAGVPISGLELVLEPGGAIRGRILGVEPAELAQVTVMASAGRGHYAAGEVSHDGSYRVPDLAAGEWQVRAHLAHGRQITQRVTLAGGGEAILDLDFAGGLTLSGQVLRAGTPLAGLHVLVRGIDVAGSARGRSDHQGRFRVEGLEPGRHLLQLGDFESGLQHRREIELAGDRDLLIEIASARIAGWVVDADDGSPLAGATISLLPAAVADGGGIDYAVPQSATSGADGGFALAEVGEGHYRLTAVRDGYAPARLELAVAGGADREGLELALTPTAGLRLTVRHSSGAPVGELSWAAVDAAGRALAGGRRAANQSGELRLPSAPVGRFDLLLAAPGSAVSRLAVEVPGPPLTVALEPAATLEVEVAELAGSTTRATLRLFAADGTPFQALRWGVAVQREWPLVRGRQTVDQLPAGRYRVEVAAADGRTWQGEASVVAGTASRVSL